VSNVIVFPKSKKGAPVSSIDEILENVGAARREQVEMLIDATLSFVFSQCYQEGFNLTEDRCVKTTALVVESLRAALYNTCNMEHSLHSFADQLFVDETQAQAQTERIMESEDPDIA
jgi:tRNA A37 threonylcarbamoyladenosine modification protein TsaB